MKKRYVVAGILAAAGLICGGIAYYQYYQDAHAGQEYEKIKEKVVTEEPEDTEKYRRDTNRLPDITEHESRHLCMDQSTGNRHRLSNRTERDR